MSQVWEYIKIALMNIRSNKGRSVLTMLGIIIGIASVVSVVALGRGSQEKIIADISAMGTNTIDIFPGRRPAGRPDNHPDRGRCGYSGAAALYRQQHP